MKKMFSRRTSDDAPRRRADAGFRDEEQSEPLQPLNTYRRNRTITGSSSARIASGNELNAEFRSPRAHVHHLNRLRRRIVLYFIGIIGTGIALYLLLGQLVASVIITVPSSTVLTLERKHEYEQQLSSYFDRNPLERLLFNTNNKKMLGFMAAKYPEIVSIDLDSTGSPGRVQALFTLRAPIAKWTLRGQNEFVDQQGIVFAYNAFAAPSLQILDSSGSTTSNGIVTSNRFLAFVGRVVGAAKSRGYTVVQATIPPLTTRQLEIKIEGLPYAIKYTIERGAGEQVEDMDRAVKYLQKSSIIPSYLDVRVKGRAVYK